MLLRLLEHIWMGKTASVFMAEEPSEVLLVDDRILAGFSCNSSLVLPFYFFFQG